MGTDISKNFRSNSALNSGRIRTLNILVIIGLRKLLVKKA